MARAGRVAGVVALVLALAGCVDAARAGQSAGAATAEVHAGASCLAAPVLDVLGLSLDPSLAPSAAATSGVETARGAPPEGFVPDTVLVCERGATLKDSAGEWRSVRATRLEGDLTPLLAGVDRASTVCTGGPGPQVWLLDALEDAVLLEPWAVCGADGVAAALDDLDVVAVTEHPVALVTGTDPGSVAG